MADKVIHEVRVIETEDGFRIEIKGDKERIKKMGFGPGFGPGMMAHKWMHRGRGRRGWRRGFGHGHHGHGHRHHGFGPMWDEESAEGGEPTADV